MSSNLQKAKRYWRIKYTAMIVDFFYTIFVILFFVKSKLSFYVVQFFSSFNIPLFLILFFYSIFLFSLYKLLSLPLDIYFDFLLEKKFNLSRQKFKDWFLDKLKADILSFIILILFIGLFYYFLYTDYKLAWLKIGIFWIIFTIFFNYILPIWIVPLFFEYKDITDKDLKEKIFNLAKKMNISILDVYELRFGKKTVKANAGFLGLGRNKRVFLADTLKENYSLEEIEVILAHEFAHYKLKHHIKLIIIISLISIICFYLLFRIFSYEFLLSIHNLPIVFIYFVIFGALIKPFLNLISREMEENADRVAVDYTGLKNAFISMIEKLSQQNLIDPQPSLFVKFLFLDHPPINERINLIRNSLK